MWQFTAIVVVNDTYTGVVIIVIIIVGE